MTGHPVSHSHSSFWRILRLLSIVAMIAMVMGAQPAFAQTATVPTITSDKTDYAPGELVTLTGANWAAGEGVHIYVKGDGDPFWELNADVVANASGGFVFAFNLPTWFIANYVVTATGSSGKTATTTFTDANIGTYDQCANDLGTGYPTGDTGCRWINGNLNANNSTYPENDATVQRLWLTAMVPGSTHTFTLKYGTTKAGTHAYDFLTTWNWSEGWITVPDRCQTIGGCEAASTESKLDIPDDPNVPNTFEPVAPGARQFVMRGGTLVSATVPTIVTGTYAGDSETAITITFTVGPQTGSMCTTKGQTTTCDVALWFGAHVAWKNDWNPGVGAGNIPGSPYHVALDALDGAAVGSRDNQMQASAVTGTGILTITKAVNGGPASYPQTNFSVSVDCIGNGNKSQSGFPKTVLVGFPVTGSSEVTGIPLPSTCSVTEPQYPAAPVGYTWTASPTISAPVVIDSTNSSGAITVTNTLTQDLGSLIISKSLSNPNGAVVPASFSISYDCGAGQTGSVSVAPGGSQTVSGLATGSVCTVSEPALTPIPGFTWGTPVVTGSPATIGKNTSVSVSVANSISRDLGSLRILKTLSNPDNAQVPASFNVSYDCGQGYTGQGSVAPGTPLLINGIPTGNTCTVTEVAPAAIPNYTWGPITYTPTSVAISAKGQTFDITVANSITHDRAGLKIVKALNNPDGAQVPASFKVNYNCGQGFTGSVDVAPAAPTTITGIPTGSTCSISEVTPAVIPGFTWADPQYSPASIVIANTTDTFTLTVTNAIARDLGSLRILKTLNNPDSAAVPATFKVNYTCGTLTGSVDVAPNAPATVNSIPTGTTCTVTEVAPAAISGFTWGQVSYSPASVVISAKGQTFDITVGNSITLNLGSLDVIKTVEWNGVAEDTTKVFSICVQGPSFPTPNCKNVGSKGGTLSWTGLIPGNYTVTEVDPGATEWDVIITGGTPAVVPAGGKATANVLNRNKVPTAVQLMYFKVKSVSGLNVTLEWATGSEINNWGYYLLMSTTPNVGTAQKVYELAVETGAGRQPGATYSHTVTLSGKQPTYFWLVDVDLNGTTTFHGPVSVLDNKIFIPQVTH